MDIIDSRNNLIRLIDLYQNLIFSICLKMTGDYFTAEDITQETFIAAFEHLASFDGKNEKAWICRIATNKCIDYKKSAARNTVPFDENTLETVLSDEKALYEMRNREIMYDLEKAIMKLEEPYRSVVKEHIIDSKTAKEISEERNIGIKTIQTQIYRAKEMLKTSLRREERTV